MLLLAYGAKITALAYILPATLAIISKTYTPHQSHKKNFHSTAAALCCFVGPIAIGIGVETLIVYSLTDYPLGRVLWAAKSTATDIHRLTTHGTYKSITYDTIIALLLSIKDLLTFDFISRLILFGTLSSCAIIFIHRFRALYPIALFFITDFLLCTYAISSIQPYTLAQFHLQRYYLLQELLGIIILCYFAIYTYKKISQNAYTKSLYTFIAFIMIISISPDGVRDTLYQVKYYFGKPNGILLTKENMKQITKAKNGNVPIAIQIPSACNEDGTLILPNSLSHNGIARAHSYFAFYSSHTPHQKLPMISRYCQKKPPYNLIVFTENIKTFPTSSVRVLLGKKGGVQYTPATLSMDEWALLP